MSRTLQNRAKRAHESPQVTNNGKSRSTLRRLNSIVPPQSANLIANMRYCCTLLSVRKEKIARYLLCFMLLALMTQSISAQRFLLGASYINTDAYFLKSLPGATIGYDQQIWRMYFFLYGNLAKHEHSYAEYSSAYHSMKSGFGEVLKGNINAGAAMYLFQSDHYGISIGTFMGLNYVHQRENITYVHSDEYGRSSISHDTIDNWYKNRWGYGFFLDMEIKQFLAQQLGLFTRIEVGYARLMDGPMPRGLPFLVYGFNSVSFSFGMKYTLRRKD